MSKCKKKKTNICNLGCADIVTNISTESRIDEMNSNSGLDCCVHLCTNARGKASICRVDW